MLVKDRQLCFNKYLKSRFRVRLESDMSYRSRKRALIRGLTRMWTPTRTT